MIHANIRSEAQSCIIHNPDPYYANRQAFLSVIATNASNFLFATDTKPFSLPMPATIYYTKRCLDNNIPFLLSLTLSLIFSHYTLKLSATAIVCHRTNNHDCIIPPPLILIIDPLPHQQQFSYFRHFISFPIPAHLQTLRNLQIIFLHISCPTPPHKTSKFSLNI